MKNNSFKEILDRLVLFTARVSSIQREIILGGHFLKNKFYGMSFLLTMPVSGTDVEWYLDKISSNKFYNKEAKEFLTPGFLKEYVNRDRQRYVELINVYGRINQIFSKKKVVISDQLIKSVKDFYNYSIKDDTYHYFGLCVWTFDQRVVPKLKKILQDYFGGSFDDAWHIITSQTELTNEQKLRIKLANLKKKYGRKISQDEIHKIQKDYRYLGIYCPEDYGYSDGDIVKFYQEIEIKKTINLARDAKDNKNKLNKLLLKCQTDKRICEIISLINYNVYFRTLRMEKICKGLALLTPMYDYLMTQFNYSRKEVGNLTKEEILDFFQNNITPPKRALHPGMLYTAKSRRPLTSQEVRQFEKRFRRKNDVEEFKGNIARQGVVRGIVKIVTSNNDLSKVRPGNILVSQFTRPDYLSAIKKSAAIITNDGGITCHAAITAREFNKPCVIGTKIATQVLHDGDVVEVDANRGIIKVLKRAGNK